MATSQQQLVCDSSTLANFKQWAQAISSFFTTATWTQSTDTGQINWSTIASVPGSSAYLYEIWQPNDGLTTFYVKMEYGNQTGANQPNVRISIGTGTNGAGTLTGLVIGPLYKHLGGVTVTTLQYECDFSGAAGRIGAIMWRNAPNAVAGMFAIERSLNASGAYTSSYVTLIIGGIPNSSNTIFPAYSQQTLVFGVGVSPTANRLSNATQVILTARAANFVGLGTTSFNNSIPFDTVAPQIGYFDYPMTMVGVASGLDIVEAVTFNVTLYGATRTYLPTKVANLGYCFIAGNLNGALCLRYD
jgi:hypothetical protein